MGPYERFTLVKCFSPEKLKELRVMSGKSQRVLAAEAGCVRQTILRAENGQVVPALRTLAVLAGALGVSVADFFDDDTAGGSR